MKREKEEKDKHKKGEKRETRRIKPISTTQHFLTHTQRRGMNERRDLGGSHSRRSPFTSCCCCCRCCFRFLSNFPSLPTHTSRSCQHFCKRDRPLCASASKKKARESHSTDFGQREEPQEKEKEETLRTLFFFGEEGKLADESFPQDSTGSLLSPLVRFFSSFFPSREPNQPTVCPRSASLLPTLRRCFLLLCACATRLPWRRRHLRRRLGCAGSGVLWRGFTDKKRQRGTRKSGP